MAKCGRTNGCELTVVNWGKLSQTLKFQYAKVPYFGIACSYSIKKDDNSHSLVMISKNISILNIPINLQLILYSFPLTLSSELS